MATLPAEGRWSIRNVADDDVPAALGFLRRDPLINVYLISRLMEERFAAATQMVDIRYNRDTVLMASLATNIVLASDPGVAHEITDAAIAVVADRILTRALPVRAIISPAALVESLWNRLRPRLDAPTVVRMNQPIYAIRGRLDYPDPKEGRYARRRRLSRADPRARRPPAGGDPRRRRRHRRQVRVLRRDRGRRAAHGRLVQPALPPPRPLAPAISRTLRPSGAEGEDRHALRQRFQPAGRGPARIVGVPTNRRNPCFKLVAARALQHIQRPGSHRRADCSAAVRSEVTGDARNWRSEVVQQRQRLRIHQTKQR